MAKTQEVLLREPVAGLGRCGDVVKVRSGYARNFLLPQRLAIAATEDNKRQISRRAARYAAEEAEMLAKVEATVVALSELVVKTQEKADEGGHLYGSVNAIAVAALVTAAGHEIEERQVRLEHPLKAVGEHKVEVHVHGDQKAEITVVVEAAV